MIPAEARNELDIKPGEKLLIMRHPVNAGLMIFKIDGAREFLDWFHAVLDQAEQSKEDA